MLSDVDHSPKDEATISPTFERSLGFYRCSRREIGILTKQTNIFTDQKIRTDDL